MDIHLTEPDKSPRGHGVILGFVLYDFDQAVERAQRLGAELIGGVAIYPDRSRAQLVRDADGYVVQLSSGPPKA
jgi:hypothetical protein